MEGHTLAHFKAIFKVRFGRGFERDFFQGECPKLGHTEKAARLLTLLSCVLSIFSTALNINHIELSYKVMEHKSRVKSYPSANKQQRSHRS